MILTCATSDTTRVDKFKRRCVWIKQNLSDKVYFKDQPEKYNVQLTSCLTVIVVKYVLSLQLLYFKFNGYIHLRVPPPECVKNTSYISQPKFPISAQCMLKFNRIDQFKKFSLNQMKIDQNYLRQANCNRMVKRGGGEGHENFEINRSTVQKEKCVYLPKWSPTYVWHCDAKLKTHLSYVHRQKILQIRNRTRKDLLLQ